LNQSPAAGAPPPRLTLQIRDTGTAGSPPPEYRQLSMLAQFADLQTPDLEGRKLTALFDVTNKCNLRCRFCHFSYDSVFHRPALHIAPAEFAMIAEQVLPLAHTAYLSAGSESLMHPRFLELLAIVARHAVPTTKLLTNGTLMTPAIADGFIEHGLSEVHFSVDGATQETYEHVRRGASWERLLANIQYLSGRKRALRSPWPLLQFNVALMQRNMRELPGFVTLAKELGVARISCRLLMPNEGLGMEPELCSHTPREANEASAQFLDLAAAVGIEVTNYPDFYSVGGEAWLPPLAPVPAAAAAPLGHVDLPPDGHVGTRSIEVGGWAVAEAGIQSIEVRRRPAPGEVCDIDGLVHVAFPKRFTAKRLDIPRLYGHLPEAWRASWGCELVEADLPEGARREIEFVVIITDRLGQRLVLPPRRCAFRRDSATSPRLYCKKPFDSVYIDSGGKVYPYPDCQTVDPFGDLSNGGSLRDVWYSEAYRQLRRRIVENDPPPMCTTCPDFINRHPDDPSFVAPRSFEASLRRPHGFVDEPTDPCETTESMLELRGWALGFAPVVRVELVRDATVEDSASSLRSDGAVLIGFAALGDHERADVNEAYPRLAAGVRAGWTYQLRRTDLPGHHGRVRAIAVNTDGLTHTLGSRRIRFIDLP